ncbi:MAG: GDP-mannose dehydrogenase [Nitrososphaerota archaeon]|nr:GDP-mannose dehydrogenase [Candidatus Bathyarchaeota archaeon]MDW8061441.1 GDP-mannose dehydrogenase [Nitrososphaerota archaeon]
MRGSIAVIGLGEVGRALYNVISRSNTGFKIYGYDSDPSRSIDRIEDIPKPIDYLHIAFPYTAGLAFLEALSMYKDRFKPRLIVVHSTVAPGTTRLLQDKLDTLVAYSPVRGRYPHIEKHLRFWVKWVSAAKREALDEGAEHLGELGFKVRCIDKPETLELAKLLETVYRAALIAIWQEMHRISMKLNGDIAGIAEFIAEVHEVLGDRPVYYPDVIGGHCLIPNTRMLLECVDSPLPRFILESNSLREVELKDPRIAEGVRSVWNIWNRLRRVWYYEGTTPEE